VRRRYVDALAERAALDYGGLQREASAAARGGRPRGAAARGAQRPHLPAPPSPAARLGIELHRRIELWAGGGAPRGTGTEELEEPYDRDPSERRGGGDFPSAEEMWGNFLASRFATMKPLMPEQPFTLYLGDGVSVTSRVDAVFEREDGTWEVVDYKTGRSEPDPSSS